MMMIMEKKAHLMTRTKWEYKQTPCSRALVGIYLCAREEEEDNNNNNNIVVVVVQTKG